MVLKEEYWDYIAQAVIHSELSIPELSEELFKTNTGVVQYIVDIYRVHTPIDIVERIKWDLEMYAKEACFY